MPDTSAQLTIGQLANRVGVRTSTLRYYEKEGLLQPGGRSPAGYRLYDPAAEQTLRFIQRAQRLGFSLAEIQTLLRGWQQNELDSGLVIDTAEKRHLALEKEITERLTLKHELEHFLQDMRQMSGPRRPAAAMTVFDRFVEQICANPLGQPTPDTVLDWLNRSADTTIDPKAGAAIIAGLRAQHVHIWQEDETYNILVVSHENGVKRALETLAALPAATTPRVTETDEGFLFQAAGPQAFIYARLFLALEAA